MSNHNADCTTLPRLPGLVRASAHKRRLAALLVATALAPALMPLLPESPARFGIARAYAKENISIDKIDLPTKTGNVTLSGITLSGSTLTKAEVEALLKSTSIAGLAQQLEKLNADRIGITAIEWRMKNDNQDMVTVYEGLEANGIKAGAITSLVIKGSRQAAKMKAGDKIQNTETAFGKFSIDALDLAGMFRWIVEADPTGKAPMKTLHGRYELESMDMKMADANVRVGKTVVDSFKARLAKTPPIDIMTLVEANAAKPGDKTNGLKMLVSMLDIYSTFEFGAGTIDGFRVVGPDKSNPGGQVTVSSGKITFNGGASPQVQLNDLDIKAQDGFFKMKLAGFQGDLYSLILVGMKEAMTSSAKPGDANAAKAEADLIKAVADAVGDMKLKDTVFKIEGIDGDFPPGKDAKSKDRVKLSLGSFQAMMGSFVNLTPTKLDYTLNGLKMPVPADSKDQGIKALRDFGIDILDLSAQIKATWDESKSRFMVDDIMADLGKFGRVSLKGELGNIPRPLFENPVQNWPIAMMGGNVQSVTLTLNNKGGVQAMLARFAGEQKKTPEQVRFEVSAMAPAMISAVMSGHPDSPALAEAISKFIKTPGTLSVTARANVPTGITVMDFTAASKNPGVLLQKLKIESSAK